MPDVTRGEFESLSEDMRDIKDLCLKTYRKLFETNGGPSVLDRLSHMEEVQQRSDEIRKWRRGICAVVIASLTVQAIVGIVTLAPIIMRMIRT